MLLRKNDKSHGKDCKVIPSENLTAQHKLLMIDLEIIMGTGGGMEKFKGNRREKKVAYAKLVKVTTSKESDM